MLKLLLWVILIILVFHMLGVFYGWYYSHPWMDIPIHISGGAFIALLAIYLFEERLHLIEFAEHSWIVKYAMVLGFVALMGIAMEFYEYFTQAYLQHAVILGCAEPGGLFDTLKDLADDLIGGTLTLLIYDFQVSIGRRKK